MKLYVFLVFLLAVVLSAVYGAPSKGSTKASLKKKQPACIKDCGDTYKPVCAGDGSGKGNISFGSECVLSNYNCENNKDIKKISDGECPGGGSIRLS